MATNKSLHLPSGFLRAPLGLGIGRYVCQLQRVTIKFCKSHGGSRGVRDFLQNNLLNYAKENPGVVVYVKPRRHRSPVLVANYLNGETQWVSVHDYSREDIVKWMELLKNQFHESSAIRLRKLWHTDFPSIQGPWTPFTFSDPALNLTEYPNSELSKALKSEPTATEELIRLFKAQQLINNEETINTESKA
ncbi:large ribosomal subunit protein mL43 [Prorops nasuta]|uniref:large ribosomal subunit protein mL43 n=1 Tax=Prorops nasuta TaxID=863751 RepID=UPI0034CD41E6